MIRDILVLLAVNDVRSAALNYSISLAKALNAFLAGAIFIEESAGANFLSRAAAITRSYGQIGIREKSVLIRFEEKRRQEKLSGSAILLDLKRGEATKLLVKAARLFDLTVLKQPDPRYPLVESRLMEATSFESGCPILVIPHFHDTQFKLERTLVYWNGAPSGTRAIAHAMPFLERSRHVELITIESDRERVEEFSAVNLGLHLLRHCIDVNVRTIVAHNGDVANRISSHAALQSADLIVMGCNGYSRRRKFIADGIARAMLESTNVPMLMAS